MGDPLPVGHGENVLSENMDALLKHWKRHLVQVLDLGQAVVDQQLVVTVLLLLAVSGFYKFKVAFSVLQALLPLLFVENRGVSDPLGRFLLCLAGRALSLVNR